MPAAYFSPGDTCWLKAIARNDGEPLGFRPLAVVLEALGQYWFWDGWTQQVDTVIIDVPAGETNVVVIPPFTWPDTGAETLTGLRFYGAVLDETMTEVFGGAAGLAQFTFGYGPRASHQCP